MPENPILTLGDWEIDEDCWELRHRGEVVPLQPKPFAVLVYLARHRHRVARVEDPEVEAVVGDPEGVASSDGAGG